MSRRSRNLMLKAGCIVGDGGRNSEACAVRDGKMEYCQHRVGIAFDAVEVAVRVNEPSSGP